MADESPRPRAFTITLIGIGYDKERRYRVTADALGERIGARGEVETVAEGIGVERWTPDRCGVMRWSDVEDLHEQWLAVTHVLRHVWHRLGDAQAIMSGGAVELGRQQVQPWSKE